MQNLAPIAPDAPRIVAADDDVILTRVERRQYVKRGDIVGVVFTGSERVPTWATGGGRLCQYWTPARVVRADALGSLTVQMLPYVAEGKLWGASERLTTLDMSDDVVLWTSVVADPDEVQPERVNDRATATFYLLARRTADELARSAILRAADYASAPDLCIAVFSDLGDVIDILDHPALSPTEVGHIVGLASLDAFLCVHPDETR
jgi:hypothetical protein